jgi:hypothetical protein
MSAVFPDALIKKLIAEGFQKWIFTIRTLIGAKLTNIKNSLNISKRFHAAFRLKMDKSNYVQSQKSRSINTLDFSHCPAVDNL